ncbi:helicase associated domain-containing protein [Streptomyces sp. NPDC002308]
MANLRRKGGLGKGPDRAAEPGLQRSTPTGTTPCRWTGSGTTASSPTPPTPRAASCPTSPAVFEGDDIGTWRWRQQEPGTRAQLLPPQQDRLTALGINVPSHASQSAVAAKLGKGKAQQAFESGLAALAQWSSWKVRAVPYRAHQEHVGGGEREPAPVRLGVFVSNPRSRRDKLTAEQLGALAGLGMDWAAPQT